MLKVTATRLFICQAIAHLSIIPMIYYGHWNHYLVSLFVYFLTFCLGITMTYHRYHSHRSYTADKNVINLFTLITTIGLIGSAISWVSVHRKHHQYSDTEKDPHSPKYKGFFYAHYLSMYAKPEIKYSSNLLRDEFLVWQHKNYFLINIIYLLILCIIDPFAVIYAYLFPAMLLWNAAGSINSYSHRSGTANNDLIPALLTFGEGYHENHHSKPMSYRFGKYDLGGYLIELIKSPDKNTV